MKQRILIFLGLAALALVASSAALAATLTTTATVSGTAGISLNLPANPSLTDTLDGTDQTVTYARSSASSTPAAPAPAGTSPSRPPTSSTARVTPSRRARSRASPQACKAGSSCTAATSSGITYPLTVNGTAAKFFNAALNTGLGKIDVTPTFSVSIPGNAYAGTYTSTVTLAAATGP